MTTGTPKRGGSVIRTTRIMISVCGCVFSLEYRVQHYGGLSWKFQFDFHAQALRYAIRMSWLCVSLSCHSSIKFMLCSRSMTRTFYLQYDTTYIQDSWKQ